MQALLGKIIEVSSDENHHRITFEPLCVLPERKAAPAHLKGQKLTVEREAADTREIGERGDSIVLSVNESRKFLRPLTIHAPQNISGVPVLRRCELWLWWWKEEEPPKCAIRVAGKTLTSDWNKSAERPLLKAGFRAFQCEFNLADLIGANLPPSIEIEVEVDGIKARHTLLPAVPYALRRHLTTTLVTDERFQLRNIWMRASVTSHNGGALTKLKAMRTPDIFGGARSHNLIQHSLDWGGHVDQFRCGWGEWNSMRDKTLDSSGAIRESSASRVTMQGNIEDDFLTTFSATLLDNWPLILTRRDFFLHEKKEEKKDELKQRIDEMRLFQTGFRCAVAPTEKTRIWCCENGEAISFRLAQENEGEKFWHWTMEDGWVLLSQTAHSHLLYFFDAQSAPHLGLWRGPHVMTLEPFWAGIPLKTGDSTGFSLGLAAGEIGGTTNNGAWVACRTNHNNEQKFALIGRFKTAPQEVAFRLGEHEANAPLSAMLLPGIGTVHVATAQLPSDSQDQEFTVTLSGEGGV